MINDLSQNESRPPYVEFKVVPVEDREASLKAGCYMTKDEVWAYIMTPGSKDRSERIASEWIETYKAQAAEGRIPQEWAKHFEQALKDFKEGLTVSVLGTPIELFTMASPSQIANLKSLKVMTIEDLAAANEEVIKRIPLQGRLLKERAVSWLQSKNDDGKLVSELERLRVERDGLKERCETLEKKLRAVEDELATLSKVKEKP